VGQFAAAFVRPGMPHGAWPMVLPMVAAGAALMAIAFAWLPRLEPARMR